MYAKFYEVLTIILSISASNIYIPCELLDGYIFR